MCTKSKQCAALLKNCLMNSLFWIQSLNICCIISEYETNLIASNVKEIWYEKPVSHTVHQHTELIPVQLGCSKVWYPELISINVAFMWVFYQMSNSFPMWSERHVTAHSTVRHIESHSACLRGTWRPFLDGTQAVWIALTSSYLSQKQFCIYLQLFYVLDFLFSHRQLFGHVLCTNIALFIFIHTSILLQGINGNKKINLEFFHWLIIPWRAKDIHWCQ